MRVVIVGGVAGGATAAARIRRLDETAEIIMIEKSNYISYANCGLPYYIGEVIVEELALTLQTPNSFHRRFNVDVRVNQEVVKIDTINKKIVVRNLIENNFYELDYDKLLLSPGAKPVKSFSQDSDKIFSLRNMEDTFKIKEYVTINTPKSCVIIGGGFIGVEIAENMKTLGLEVTIIQKPNQLMNNFDKDMAVFIHSEMRKNKVNLLLGKTIKDIHIKPDYIEIILNDGEILKTDFICEAIGVIPDTKLAKDAGIKLGIKDSIIVNEKMETSTKDVYAVGDAVQIKNFVTNRDTLISLAGPANKQARIAADNICGKESKYTKAMGSSIIKVFNLTCATTGINEKTAKSLGINYDKVILSPMSHASYYPNSKVMTIKVLFEKESYKILGAQIIGYDGVDKRIDVLATAIYSNLTVVDLKDIDLAYAPPYSSAKDPINMIGFISDNIKDNIVKQWYLEEVNKIVSLENVVLLDTRTKFEYNNKHIDGFINIPVDDLRVRINEIPKDKPVYVICQSGIRSYIATRILVGNGYEAYNFAGGYRYYSANKYEERLIEKQTKCGMNINEE